MTDISLDDSDDGAGRARAGCSGDGYDIGYGKPPKHTRFKPGQSGNPRGRAKGSRGLKTDLAAELSASHTIQINGKPVRGSRQQLTLKTLTIRAASGDLKATSLVLTLLMQVLGTEDRGGSAEKLSLDDQALLDHLLTGVDPAGSSDDGSTGDAGTAGDPPPNDDANDPDEHDD